MIFEQAKQMFKEEAIRELANDQDGLRYLKLRSLSRREYLEKLFQFVNVDTSGVGARQLFPMAYETSTINNEVIDTFIRSVYKSERNERLQREPELINQLYRMQVFDWGGLHQNSLEKTIVNNYVKKIANYDLLSDKIENELHSSLRGYVLCSWYNHWTSIIIEDVFRDHSVVLPAIGQVKKVDFFINNVPFDLKVTYLPEGYIRIKRRTQGLRPELTLLKRSARKLNIVFDRRLASAKLLEDLWIKHKDHPSEEAQQLIRELHEYRLSQLNQSCENPNELICWLYENQGERRFDASNRLFLILVDTNNFFESWKLKRAKPLLDEKVHSYLDEIGENPGREVKFNWQGSEYSAVSDVVFVVHPQ